MRNANITKWADELSTTNEQQVTGALCQVGIRGDAAYCCLGFGSTLVPNLYITMPSAMKIADSDDNHAKALFGATEADGLAPPEFMEWLGYVMDDDPGQRDVYFDFPDNLRVRSAEDRDAANEGGDVGYDEEGAWLPNLTAADANDSGFTFAQIADIIHHFGLADDIKPVIVHA